MAIINYTAADFATAFINLLPRGIIWNKFSGSIMSQVINALTPSTARNYARANNLITDSFVGTTVELLPEWEASLGLPDACQGVAPTIATRRAQAISRFVGVGGQSVPYIVNYAANLGYTITITEYSSFGMGSSAMGSTLADDSIANYWVVNSALYNLHLFGMGISAMGESLGTFGNATLECELRKLAPAQTVVQFAYT